MPPRRRATMPLTVNIDYKAYVWQVLHRKWAKYSEFQSLDIY